MDCNFTLSESEVVSAMQLHGRGSKLTLISMGCAEIALVLLGVFTEYKTLGFGGAIGGFLGFLVTQLIIVPLKAKKQYQQLRTLRSEMTVKLSDNEISIEVETGESKLSWSDIHKWKFGSDVYLLYVTSNMFYMIPSRAVDDESVLVNLLLQRVGPKKV